MRAVVTPVTVVMTASWSLKRKGSLSWRKTSLGILFFLLTLDLLPAVFAFTNLTSQQHIIHDSENVGVHWDYHGDMGPHQWKRMYKNCSGRRQSPVDIITRDVIPNSELGELVFEDYDMPLKEAVILNNGHTVQISSHGDQQPMLQGGGLKTAYKFSQLHFHWGNREHFGSEHAVDGFKYPMEAHFVHFHPKYAGASEATKYEDGLAVIAAFFEITEEPNENLTAIVSELKKVVNRNQEDHFKDDLIIANILPEKKIPYYRYYGSLTTPPCAEAIQWIVLANTIPIGRQQMQAFRNLHEGASNQKLLFLINNFRPPQRLNKRIVEVYNSADLGQASSEGLLFGTILACMLQLVSWI